MRWIDMARRRRFSDPGIPLHIVHRGNNRGRVFNAEHEYRLYLHRLEELSLAHQCKVHAYALMPNHVHLLVTPEVEMGVSRMMKRLAQLHAQFINRFHRRTGALWEGRFHSSVVEDSTYLFNCYRYIELNPVRAGMAHHPGECEWTSYKANAEGVFCSLIAPHRLFIGLGETDTDRRAAYRGLFNEPLDDTTIDELRRAGRASIALGSDAFKRSWAEKAGLLPGSDPRV